MSDYNGKFCWYELMTTDPNAAKAFYKAVVGWNMQDMSVVPGESYTVLSAGQAGIGGLMKIPEEACKAGAKPGWVGYVAVDDVDAYAKRVTTAGGSVRRPPDDIPTIGRFSVVADPEGAVFVLFKPFSTEKRDIPPPGTPGQTDWHELHVGNYEKALPFYETLFGWKRLDALDMGPMGRYQLFTPGGDQMGGMMSTKEAAPYWLYYVHVDEILAAEKRVKQNGGEILMGPQQVPGGAWILNCRDPQGVVFALVGPRAG